MNREGERLNHGLNKPDRQSNAPVSRKGKGNHHRDRKVHHTIAERFKDNSVHH